MTKMAEKWTFDAPYTASFNGSGADRWLGLKAHGMLVASYSVKEWGSEQACIEAAWRHAYDTPADLSPSPEVVKELVEALESLLEAITAENRHGDRSLTITGPTANLKWLLEAQEDARAVLAKLEGGE